MAMPKKEDEVKYCKFCNMLMSRKRHKNGDLESNFHFNRRIYCDVLCMRKDKLNKGKNTSSWSTSHTTSRKISELFLDTEACSICGESKKIDIHHIDGDYNNNSLDNLQPLCRSCHTKIHKTKVVCMICGGKHKGLGYCEKHYQRFKKYGDANYTKNQIHKIN